MVIVIVIVIVIIIVIIYVLDDNKAGQPAARAGAGGWE